MSNAEKTVLLAKELFKEERKINKLDGWFRTRESVASHEGEYANLSKERRASAVLADALRELPIFISDNAVFAGTQRDAFARSYALINPSFRVETFSGYCDPTAVFNDIDADADITAERIEKLRAHTKETPCKLLANPKKYAPSGVYIVRIHGTFVNFLDLSPAIQEDIIKRLDLASTANIGG